MLLGVCLLRGAWGAPSRSIRRIPTFSTAPLTSPLAPMHLDLEAHMQDQSAPTYWQS
jgi:hypothetical protein